MAVPVLVAQAAIGVPLAALRPHGLGVENAGTCVRLGGEPGLGRRMPATLVGGEPALQQVQAQARLRFIRDRLLAATRVLLGFRVKLVELRSNDLLGLIPFAFGLILVHVTAPFSLASPIPVVAAATAEEEDPKCDQNNQCARVHDFVPSGS